MITLSFPKLTVAFALAVALSGYAPVQTTPTTCDEQSLELHLLTATLLEANATTLELSVDNLRMACKTPECRQVFERMLNVAKRDRKTAQFTRDVVAEELKRRGN
jgi:hypothetical protein